MHNSLSILHSVAIEVSVSSEVSFKFLSDPFKLGKWALGCFQVKTTEDPELFTGVSLMSEDQTWLRIKGDKSVGVIDYYVGTYEHQIPRISARVISGTACGRNPDHSVISLQAWRGDDMNDERWHRLCVTHEAEIMIIKFLAENEGKSDKSKKRKGSFI